MPVRIIAGITAEKPRLAAANLMTVCIVIGIAAEEARLAAADLLPVRVVMRIAAAKEIEFASTDFPSLVS